MDCRHVQPKLSEYIDNALSARATWEIDRHLAACGECSQMLAEMSRTVNILQAAQRYEVSDEFTARLEARLAAAEPAPAQSAWLLGLADALRPRRLPIWGMGAATCALVVVLVLSNSPVMPPPKPIAGESQARVRMQSVALSAADPLQDLATANLAAASDSPTDAEGER